MKKIILSTVAILYVCFCYGQSNKYTGKVLMSSLPISPEGVEVTIEGDGYTLYSIINELGEFYIDNPQYPFKVIFNHVTIYKSIFKVKDAQNKLFIVDYKFGVEVNVVSKSRNGVTSYRSRNSAFMTHVVTPRASDMSLHMLFNRLNMIPGVRFFNGRVRIRVSGSVKLGDEPLFIIDGIIHPLDSGLIDDLPIDVNNVESIEVLKAASETTIYGQKGVNGVIIIRTKGSSVDLNI